MNFHTFKSKLNKAAGALVHVFFFAAAVFGSGVVFEIAKVKFLITSNWKTISFGLPRWLRDKKKIHLPIQETWVQFLIQEDLIRCRATKPVCHDC